MKKQLTYFTVILVLITARASAQNDVDALRYSQTSLAGTARYTAMGGAFSALGGDFSVLSTNPAGIAIYRSSEFSMSPSLYKESSESSYLGSGMSDGKYNFNFGNIGFVFTHRNKRNENSQGWKNWNFGIGYNRLNNFNAVTSYQGINNDNSLLDKYLEQANAGGGTYYGDITNNFPYGAGLAWQTYLIDTLNGDPNHYHSAIQNYGELQRNTIESRGSMGEIVLSFGGNYNDQLYVGGTVGFDHIYYEEYNTYQESDPQNNNDNFKSFLLNNYLQTSGTGINFKFGMIYRPVDLVRFGFAIHTPTFFWMHDDYSSTMHSEFNGGYNYTYSANPGLFDYDLTTPMKVIGGVGFVVGKAGLISADYEFIDYSEAKLNSPSYKFFDENSVIRAKYAATGNLHIGTEWRYDVYSFRAGYAMNASPFKAGIGVPGADQSRNSFSGGIGFRAGQNLFLDLAYVYSTGTSFYQPYDLSTEQVQGASNDITTHNFTLTFGVKF